MLGYLRDNDLLNATQHGFLRRRSVTTNLLQYMEVLTRMMDEGNPVDIIYCDYQKAFDKVPHHRLSKSVEKHGILDQLLKWT